MSQVIRHNQGTHRRKRGRILMYGLLPIIFYDRTWQWPWWWQLGVTAGGVDTAYLDEASHQHYKSNSHQQHCPPVILEVRIYKKYYFVQVIFTTHCVSHVNGSLTTIHSAIFSQSCALKMAFFSLAKGPSASTRRHLMKTSQQPLQSLQGEPGCSVLTFLLKNLVHLSEPVLAQVLGVTGDKRRKRDFS